MPRTTTFAARLKEAIVMRNITQTDLARQAGLSKSSISRYLKGDWEAKQDAIYSLSLALNVSEAWLMGYDVSMQRRPVKEPDSPDFAAFPILGDVAAGYDRYAVEDWDGPLVRIPIEDLHGRPASDFFALRVSGNSMFPQYVDGDLVLVLRQATLNRSGDIGVMLYNDDDVTIKKVEYVMGEDWLRLIPINPNYEPILIENEALEHCRVLGIPWMLIRYLEE